MAPLFPLSDRASDVRPGCKTQRIAPTLRQVADLVCARIKEREYFKTCIVGHVNCCLQCGLSLMVYCSTVWEGGQCKSTSATAAVFVVLFGFGFCAHGSQPSHASTTVRGVLEVACRWILHGTTNLQVSSGFKLLNSWGASSPGGIFPAFFTPELVSRLLQGQTQSQHHVIAANIPLLLRESFRVMSRAGPPVYYAHAQVVQLGVANLIRRCACGDRHTVRNVGLLLQEFPECVPASDAHVLDLCTAILEHLSLGVPPQDGKEILKFIRLTDEIARFLSSLWASRPHSVLETCLSDLFRIISSTAMEDGQRAEEPPICLAAVVQYIPIELANRVVKSVVTDPNIPEPSIECAVGQIVEWLKWPSARSVDVWLSCFLTELAAHKKFSVLVRITEFNTEQVAENLMYPQLRPASFKILSQMLLSFQHSPAPFHKALDKLLPILGELQRQAVSSVEAQSWLHSLACLLQCLMHQHTGFPELYDPVLDLIKDCPSLSTDAIKGKLLQNSWLTQVSGSVVVEMGASTPLSGFMVNQRKLEEGKTGLDNLGNTCYMNSVLQALYMCDQFRRGILTKVPSAQESLLEKLQYIFALLSQSNRPSISPLRLLQASRPPWFLPGQQQDCSEFLKYLLDCLHEEEKEVLGACNGGSVLRSLSSSSSGSTSPGGTLKKSERKEAVTLTSIKMKTEEEMSGLERRNSGCSRPSLVENSFKGKVLTTLRCLTCKAESTRSETFSDIPLAFPNWSQLSKEFPQKNLAGGSMSAGEVTVVRPLETASDKTVPVENNELPSACDSAQAPGENSLVSAENAVGAGNNDSFTLNDLITFYLKSERLTGDNKYHCEKCGKLQDGERSIAITESPNYLILTLLRFSYDTKLQSRTKIFQDVRYPRTLAIPVAGDRADNSKNFSWAQQGKQHIRNSSGSNGILINNNNSDSALCQEKLDQLARQLCPSVESSSPDQQRCELYGLSAVIVHSGTSSECGHYYCYARHSQAGQVDATLVNKLNGNLDDVDLLPDRWYNFNDSRVSHATFETFSNVTKRFSKDTAYVLIYRKLDLNAGVTAPSLDAVLRPELRDSVIRDNETFLKEQEVEAQVREQQRRRSSSVDSAKFTNWTNRDNKDDDDDDDDGGGYRGPGCNPGLGGLDTSGSRFIF
ncbi:ubiquitin carboxyl-terminal hydrolase 38-like [Plakobranchus ocellatus]|uniref:Ubiquitin carboxyl-terminal hydrolase 38-like n=1 Tax=Plakobranchus ocellatus TaxID=259542 RepID=A0AAV3Y0C8_9GAST|nr:ubiquitin carboxyl-terminal hydrolase 38-like [Plakobranchus ocellatus]